MTIVVPTSVGSGGVRLFPATSLPREIGGKGNANAKLNHDSSFSNQNLNHFLPASILPPTIAFPIVNLANWLCKLTAIAISLQLQAFSQAGR